MCLPAPLPTKLKLLLFLFPSFHASFVHTQTQFLTHRSLNVLVFFFKFPFLSLLIKALSLSDLQLNIDGLEIAEVPQMLSVLRRGQVWRTIKSNRFFSGTRFALNAKLLNAVIADYILRLSTLILKK